MERLKYYYWWSMYYLYAVIFWIYAIVSLDCIKEVGDYVTPICITVFSGLFWLLSRYVISKKYAY